VSLAIEDMIGQYCQLALKHRYFRLPALPQHVFAFFFVSAVALYFHFPLIDSFDARFHIAAPLPSLPPGYLASFIIACRVYFLIDRRFSFSSQPPSDDTEEEGLSAAGLTCIVELNISIDCSIFSSRISYQADEPFLFEAIADNRITGCRQFL